MLLAAAVFGKDRRLASDEELKVLYLVNKHRAAGYQCPLGHVYPPNQGAQLVFDCRLWAASYKHSQDMQLNEFFSHTSVDGREPSDRRAAEGASDGLGGENIIRGWPDADGAVRSWMKSDKQCKLIMDPTWTALGVGVHYRRRSRYLYYWTQSFSTSKAGYTTACVPRTRAPTVSPTIAAPTQSPTSVILLDVPTSSKLPLRCEDPELHLANSICDPRRWSHVDASQTAVTDTPFKCQAAVASQCGHRSFFSWRRSNSACHCVTEGDCQNPQANRGLDIYKVSCEPGCLEPVLHLEDHICHRRNWRHTAVSQTAEADTPEKCQESVMLECGHTAFFSWRRSNLSCHCVEEAHCDNPKANLGLTIYRTNCDGSMYGGASPERPLLVSEMTAKPSPLPTPTPSAVPSASPSATPSLAPSCSPTASPTQSCLEKCTEECEE